MTETVPLLDRLRGLDIIAQANIHLSPWTEIHDALVALEAKARRVQEIEAAA